MRDGRAPLAPLLAFVLVSFAANSLVTRVLVSRALLDPGLASAVRFVAGALALAAVAILRGRAWRPTRANAWPALALGAYALLISYGYQHIGAAPGTLVFYAAVLATLVAADLARGTRPTRLRVGGALLALAGVATLALGRLDTVTPLGVALLGATGAAWGLYTLAGRGVTDALGASAANFTLLALVLAPPAALAYAGLAGRVVVTGEGLALAAFMGAGTTAFAYVAWYACLDRLSGAEAGTWQLAIPILTAAGAVALLGEPLSLGLVAASALVTSGLAVATRTG